MRLRSQEGGEISFREAGAVKVTTLVQGGRMSVR
jgi:hypothetical protein